MQTFLHPLLSYYLGSESSFSESNAELFSSKFIKLHEKHVINPKNQTLHSKLKINFLFKCACHMKVLSHKNIPTLNNFKDT